MSGCLAFLLYFPVGLHLAGQIYVLNICIYFEYIHEMGIARHFEVFSQYLIGTGNDGIQGARVPYHCVGARTTLFCR